MQAVTYVTPAELQALKALPQFTAAHAALLEILLSTGEWVIQNPDEDQHVSPIQNRI